MGILTSNLEVQISYGLIEYPMSINLFKMVRSVNLNYELGNVGRISRRLLILLLIIMIFFVSHQFHNFKFSGNSIHFHVLWELNSFSCSLGTQFSFVFCYDFIWEFTF